jgi:hypothetical protein
MDLYKVLVAVRQLLAEPNPKDPLMVEIVSEMMSLNSAALSSVEQSLSNPILDRQCLPLPFSCKHRQRHSALEALLNAFALFIACMLSRQSVCAMDGCSAMQLLNLSGSVVDDALLSAY